MGMAAQQTLTIYEDAASTNSFVPIYGYWCDSYLKCEFVVPSTELTAMTGKDIKQLTWYLSEAPSSTSGNGYYGYENYSGVLQGNLSAFLPAASFTYEASEPVFSLVGFNDWDNPIAIGEDGVTIDVEQQNFEDPNDTAQEFKIITTNENGEPVWLGGVDENNVGFFMIENSMLDAPISLDDAGANFRLPEPGNYTIHLAFLDKSTVSGLIMFVTKNEVTAVNGIAAKTIAGVKYYNLAGVESLRPFNGINVVVTTYSDGTTSTSKMVK